MNVFITGGGGFLGSYIVRQLVARGYSVTNYSRNSYAHLTEMGVRCVQGNLNDYRALEQAMKGHDACFHVASKVAMWGKEQDFYRTNVVGTQNIIQSCLHNKIDKLIYTSTPSVVFGRHGISGEDESLSYPKESLSAYARSKAIAEQIVLKAAETNLHTVALRPHLVFGPGDQNLIPRLVSSAKKNKLKIIGDGKNQVDVLYVQNAADAHLCALDVLLENPKSITAQAFFLGQGPVKLWEFINKILYIHKLAPIEKKISAQFAYKLGALIEWFSSLLRIYNWTPPMTRFVALQLSENHFYSHDKARRLLKWTPKIKIEDALRNIS